ICREITMADGAPRPSTAISRAAIVRIAALFVFLAALAELATLYRVRVVSNSFAPRADVHLGREVERLRRDIGRDENELDAAAQRVTRELSANPNASRAQMFATLRALHGASRGMRVLAPNGNPVAWWGQELRVSGAATYLFDATSLYITKSVSTPRFTVQAFERVPNETKRHSLWDPDDDWLVSSMFHAGALRQENGARRYVVAQRQDATLYVDVVPRTRAAIVDSARHDGHDVAGLLIAIGAIVVLAMWGTGKSACPPLISVVVILVARAAMLPFTLDEDPTHVFGFDVYASRILGPFTKSPFDLLLTAAAVLAIAVAAARVLPAIVRALLALAGALGFAILASNLVDNSRISSLPDHIVPASLAQAVILAALLLFGLALLKMTGDGGRGTAVAIGIVIGGAALIAVPLDLVKRNAFLAIAAAFAIAFAVQLLTTRRSLRLLASALLLVLVVWWPMQAYERASARKFIADTYAPLVVGEGGQLRTMIEDTLQNQFSQADLSTILPDHFSRMNLEDLAYALWLRSDLSKWRVPAVITIRDVLDHPLSRFGVGLPQFSERGTQQGQEF